MRTRLLTLTLCGLLALTASADDTKDNLVVKEIEIKGVKLEPGRGRPNQPQTIATAQELEKVFPDKETRDQISKGVDFDKHKLVYFAWAGSGQDRITSNVVEDGGKKGVVFTYTPGRTKDLRQHFRLFALGKNVTFRMAR